MADLANIDELATMTRMPATDARLVAALRRASDRFTAACEHRDGDGNYCLLLVTDDEVRVSGRGTDTLLLPSAPVRAVASVRVGGQLLQPAEYQVGSRIGVLRRVNGTWPDGLENIEVTYTHGYPADKVPGDISDAVLEHAATLATSSAHVQQESAMSKSAGYFAAAMVGTTQKWVDAVDRHSLNRGDQA